MPLCYFFDWYQLNVNKRRFDDDFKNMSIIKKSTSKLRYCKTNMFWIYTYIYAFWLKVWVKCIFWVELYKQFIEISVMLQINAPNVYQSFQFWKRLREGAFVKKLRFAEKNVNSPHPNETNNTTLVGSFLHLEKLVLCPFTCFNWCSNFGRGEKQFGK